MIGLKSEPLTECYLNKPSDAAAAVIGRNQFSTTQLRRVRAIDHNNGSLEHNNGRIDDACKQ
jgi:hypothetical protein